MAMVRNPLLSMKAIGSIEALTFSIWKGEPVVRRKAIPAVRLRVVQMNRRAIFGYLSRSWGELDDTERQLWRDYATEHPGTDKFGEAVVLSGSNMFTKLNARRMGLDSDALYADTPPVADAPATMATIVVSKGNGAGEIDVVWTLNGTPVLTDFNEVWVAGPYQSPGRVEVAGSFKVATTVAGTTLSAVLSGLPPNAWYWVKARYVDEFGQATAFLIGQAQAGTGV